MYTTENGNLHDGSSVDDRYVTPEFLLPPPNVDEPPAKLKESRGWFWQKAKKEDKDKSKNS